MARDRSRDGFDGSSGEPGRRRSSRADFDLSQLGLPSKLDKDALRSFVGPEMVDRYGAALARAERILDDFNRRTPAAKAAAKRARQRRLRSAAIRARRAALSVLLIFAAYVVYSLFVQPLGLVGLFAAGMLAMAAAVLVALLPVRQLPDKVSDTTPAPLLVQRLDAMLHQRRAALPAPAINKLDTISAQLPLLEQRLATLDPLDPLAQDARRLVGSHIPDLLERFDAVPADMRRSAEVEARFVAGLDAAQEAVSDLAGQLARSDVDALATHGRFLESKYRGGSSLS